METIDNRDFKRRTRASTAPTMSWPVLLAAMLLPCCFALAEMPGPVVKFVPAAPPIQTEEQSSTIKAAEPVVLPNEKISPTIEGKSLIRLVKPTVITEPAKTPKKPLTKKPLAKKPPTSQSLQNLVHTKRQTTVKLAKPTAKHNDDYAQQIEAVVKRVTFEFAEENVEESQKEKKLSLVRYAPPKQPKAGLEVIDDQAGDGSLQDIDDHYKPIAALTASIRSAPGDLPTNHAAARFVRAGHVQHAMGYNRAWQMYEFSWLAPGLCHQPLYFEDYNLERYGYNYGVAQPLLSAAHFFARIPAMPYLATLEKPRECVYTLGYYRPGSYAPHQLQKLPIRLDASTIQGVATTGLIFLIP